MGRLRNRVDRLTAQARACGRVRWVQEMSDEELARLAGLDPAYLDQMSDEELAAIAEGRKGER